MRIAEPAGEAERASRQFLREGRASAHRSRRYRTETAGGAAEICGGEGRTSVTASALLYT
jgi:hypothetical protein